MHEAAGSVNFHCCSGMDLADLFLLNFLVAVLSVPLLWGWVPRNRLYGFRVPATLRDDEVWYAMNRRVARQMIPVGTVLATVVLVAQRAGLETPAWRISLTALTLTALAVITIRGWVAASRLARRAPESRER